LWWLPQERSLPVNIGLNSMHNTITAAIFAAYLKCPTKAYLMAHGEKVPDTFFADIRERISAAFKARVNQNLRMGSPNVVPIDFLRLVGDLASDGATLFVDCETALCACDDPASLRDRRWVKRSALGHNHVPILYSACSKSDQSDDLLVCFGALAIALATRTEIPQTGKVIYGQAHRGKTVRIADHRAKTQQVVEAIVSACHAVEPPSLVLNKHCPTCDFQPRCRALAVEREALSLFGGMTAKERAKCEEKGITTVTQLSYGYRPRRRRRAQPTAPRGSPPVKHDHKLKALAIKKAQIHVVGSPSLSFKGTPVFMDVEGMPDRKFYYLIGLRYAKQGTYVEKSFWADEPEDESNIWRECVRALKEIDNPQIVHYGAYESRFLKHMRKRWKPIAEDAEFIDRLVDGSLNLLASIYGRIYFPTYTNSLKDIARWLGFEWTWPQVSGGAALLWRRCWELTSDDGMRRQLIAYNIEDCRAVALVAAALARICSHNKFVGAPDFETVNTDSLEVGFRQTYGKFTSPVPDFEKINAAAYWDYQRSKIFVRTSRAIRRRVRKTVKPLKKVIVEKQVDIDKPESCSVCGASQVRIEGNISRVIFDLKFTRRGIKRWAIRYRYKRCRCGVCRADMTCHLNGSKYGPHLRVYIIYLLIEMRLSRQKIAEHVSVVFNVPIFKAIVSDMKSSVANKYEPTYRRILEQIASGHLVHADETKGIVRGDGHYVWIFANLTSVAYVYSATREASILGDVLAGFKGVLVSDFYGGYDAISCRQQKCLIHLMRDINEDVVRHPFNEELTFVATRFGALLREIVETIDRYGLKKRHLWKHKRAAEQFMHEVGTLQCATEAATSLKKRIEKNKDKLFTFLDYDNVPWNNNNAEHAVRAFTRLRNMITISTPKGHTGILCLINGSTDLAMSGQGIFGFPSIRQDRNRWLTAGDELWKRRPRGPPAASFRGSCDPRMPASFPLSRCGSDEERPP
jgi:predicted RecB family nuclease